MLPGTRFSKETQHCFVLEVQIFQRRFKAVMLSDFLKAQAW